eukprot:5346286-Pyramimonas_sp.AAC.1
MAHSAASPFFNNAMATASCHASGAALSVEHLLQISAARSRAAAPGAQITFQNPRGMPSPPKDQFRLSFRSALRTAPGRMGRSGTGENCS